MSINHQQVVKYINLAREYPKYYVALIDQQLNSFIDETSIKLDEEIVYQTIEGKSAWEEAKQFLINQEPLKPFDRHQGLFKASQDHVQDIMMNNSSGHIGSDGSTFIDRLQRYSKKGKGSMIQLLGTTYLIKDKNSIELALINLIIDDGVSNRGHRKALFNKDYKYIGACFVENAQKVFSVISMSQSNLEELKSNPQSIATSTSQLKSTNKVPSEVKEQSVRSFKENCIDSSEYQTQKEVQPIKVQKSSIKPPTNDQVWTLKNVSNLPHGQAVSQKSVASRQSVPQKLQAEPSIFKDNEQSHSNSKSSIGNFDVMINQKPVKQNRQSRISKRIQSSHSHVKQNSIKNSQQSIKSQMKQKTQSSNGYGLSSNVEEFKVKSTFNSPFLKTNTSGFGASNPKKVVQKKQTMRTWNQEEYLVKEITTVLKYDDGSMQDWVEKHSVLKEGSSS